MKILLTGGTGFVGCYVVPLLLQAGHDVSLLVREAYGMGTPLPEPLNALRADLQLVFADLRNYSMTRRAIADAAPDSVIHLAAAGATSPFLPIETALRHNVHGTTNLLRAACEKRQVDKLIVARTPGELTSMNPYAASKAAAWNFCQMYARTQRWPIVGAMIFQSYGWGQPAHALIPSAFNAAMANEDLPMTAGLQRRDWIHADDVAQGIVKMISAEIPTGTTLELGTGRAASVREVVETIYRVCGSTGKPLVGALAGRPGEEQVQTASPSANSAIDWSATRSLESGLRHYFAQCTQQRQQPVAI